MRGARLARDVWNDPEFAGPARAAGRRPEAPLQPRLLGRGRRVLRARARRSTGEQVDSLTSNIGHLLWSGIVDKSKAKAVVRHLMGERLFSGWGVRTLAEGEARYNPIGYHVGTVWPFDNSFIAWGLRRYGFKDEAARDRSRDPRRRRVLRRPPAGGVRRLPARRMTKYPVQYPTACSPQAWSTGAPLLLLRTMLGLEPLGEHLVVDPALPARDRPSRAARHSRPLGPRRRVRSRTGRDRPVR